MTDTQSKPAVPAPPKVKPPTASIRPRQDVPIERRIENADQIKHLYGLV